MMNMDYASVLEKRHLTIEKGHPHPLGATPDRNGVNFSIFSEQAEFVELLLFDKHDDLSPSLVISTSRRIERAHTGEHDNEVSDGKENDITRISLNKTFHFWHVYLRGLRPGIHYAYRIGGPQKPEEGHRFDPEKVLIDPYSRGNNHKLWDAGKACQPGDNLATSMRSVIIDTSDYDWGKDSHVILRAMNENPDMSEKPLNKGMPPELNETIIYELHVGGFTRNENSGVAHPGTFSGVIEKIPYLEALGITAVELMPIFDFDDSEHSGRKNYWGYDTVGFFAPHSSYCINSEHGEHLKEFRDMVKALHKKGIGVILDVVFNHTAEGNERGPTFSLKGIDNSNYYHLVPDDKQYYMNYSGCGNTVNCNHPITQKMILECLRFWVQEMHVDGFRFDEGTIMSRGMDGKPMPYPPVIWQIELDDELGYTKVIAEAWDAAALNQVGYFPGYRWAEWNGYFRDDIRRFVKGDSGLIGKVASRIAGSSDLYQSKSRLPLNSVNFVTCHDGFSLNDLVSYNCKHNEANGEGNRDGNDNNISWNCGVEGETDDLAINALRERQIKNFASLLLLSVGVPMICMGDEVRHTQKGNNNAYCQDNELSWFDWDLLEKNSNLFRFWKLMIDFRKRHSAIRRTHYFIGEMNERGFKDISWHGCKLERPGWDDPNALALAFTLAGFNGDEDIHVMVNMYWEALEFEIPAVEGRKWYRAVDTFLASPMDIADPGQEILIEGNSLQGDGGNAYGSYLVNGRSIVVLISK